MQLSNAHVAPLIALIIAGGTRAAGDATLHRASPPFTIATMSYLRTYQVGDTVRVFRGTPADITVKGHLVDLATGVEAKTASGGAPSGIFVFTGTRQGGDNSNIVISLSSAATAPLGTYQVLLHYLVETNGPDRFLVRLYDRGQIDDLHIVEPAEPSGVYLTGKTYTLRATGQQMSNATLFVAKTGIPGLSLPSPPPSVPANAIARDIPIRFASGGSFTFDASDFVDQNLSPLPSASGCTDECYSGNAQLKVQVAAVPIIASVSATTPAAGSSVTISGTALTSSGLSATVSGLVRYGGSSSHKTTITPTASGGNLAFTADANLRQDSLTLDYHVNGSPFGAAPIFSVPLPNIAVQGGTPVVTQLDSLSLGGTTRHVLVPGTHVMLGRFLAPYPLVTPLVLVDPVIPSGLPRSLPVQSPAPAAAPASPTIKFGQNDLVVKSSRYFQNAKQGFTIGVDSVAFDMIGFTDTLARTLTVTTPFGSTSVTDVLAVPVPTIGTIRRKFSDGQTSVVTDNALIAGATYDVGGTALILTGSGHVLQAASLKLNGQPLSITQPALTTAGSTLTFIVPSNATSGTLTATTIAGTASRAVTVQPPPPQLTIVGVQASPNPVVGGQGVTATIALSAPVTSGANAGTLVFTQSSTASTVSLPVPVAIHTNPVVVQIPTRVTRNPVTSTITVTNPDATGSLASSSTTITVVPPSPTSMTLGAASVVGGQPVTATIQMTGGAVLADSISIAMTTDDPTTVTPPATVRLNGSSANVQVVTHVVPATRTVTISAISGGQTRSATLTVTPPTVATVAPKAATTIGATTDTVLVTLSAALPSTQSATVACTGQGLTCPTTMSLTGSSGSVIATVADVPTERTGTITVTFNGVSTNGTIDMKPIGIQSATMSPASVRAGAGSSLTLQLNHATSALVFHFTSSDPTVVPAPPNVSLAAGQLTQIVPLTTITPQAVSKTVTITATATRTTALGTSTITGSATLTVTP